VGPPGPFAALLAGTALYWPRAGLGGGHDDGLPVPVALGVAVPWPTLAWLDALETTLPYLSVALPFALVTIIGGIDNTESAAAAGDEYRARDILLTEAGATVLAALCGGVVQNTPYLGHPAYKAMGARAGYTFATGLVIGGGAAAGALSLLVAVLPEAAIAPILVFIGLEITAQGFLASPPRHGAAVALAFVPVAAAVVLIETGGVLSALGASPRHLTGDAALTHAPGWRRRRAGCGLRACGGPRPCACRRANIGLTSFVTRVLNGRGVVNVVTMRRPRGGVMSAFGKSMTAVVAGAALILVAGTLG